MCGIAGVVHLDGSAPDPAGLRQMGAALAHRGPDGEGYEIRGPAGLAHRRLAVIDLSAAGLQPMTNERGTLWLTYNGEIYNYRALRAELVALGHQFRSASDSEVILHAYEAWGQACLARFNGQFAFALWDGDKGGLWLARDRLGIKPLFYSLRPDRLLFGSEIKALLAYEPISRQLDEAALAYYLALNYMPAPHTLLAAVRQLQPAESLWLDVATGRSTTQRYWQLQFDETDHGADGRYRQALQTKLAAAVERRLVSDVPFGVFLSGGLDSSTIAYWMNQTLTAPLQSFSVAYQAAGYDESAYASLVATHLGTQHHERAIGPNAADILPAIVYHAEEPTADSSMVALYHLAKLARESVTMVLAGDGADEILAGYETYIAHDLGRVYRRLPGLLRRGVIAPLVGLLPHSEGRLTLAEKLRRFVAAADLDGEMAHASWREIGDAASRRALLDRPDIADFRQLYRAVFAESTAQLALNRLLDADIRFYLPNDMLAKVDRMTMAHGLEARVPFLDHELVELAAALPPRLKLRGRTGKWLLRQLMAERLPAAILQRPKQGFNAPVAGWLRRDLRPLLHDSLSPARLQNLGFLHQPTVLRLLMEHDSGRRDHSHQLWGLLCLALWWEKFQ
ncbi:MAG: asparagine synthase (glutamine-hydrolyzing) [Ardenticatenales bacterium]|nr:asparagine synthase (glutamine-hydrolyzing) [Ardenticatenales bacterium]